MPRVRLSTLVLTVAATLSGPVDSLSAALLVGEPSTAAGPAAAPAVAPGDDALPRRPNILFLFSDDHAQAALGCYGGPLAAVDPTPRLDALAAQGARFENSFCTNAICGPSRAVILTGKHSHANGFARNGDTFDGDQQTFPKLLRAAGYRTALIGKWHLGSDPQGFDHWEVLPGQGDYYDPRFLTADGDVQASGHSTRLIADKALDWLEAGADDERPFLLMCQFKAPHRNWMPPPEHLDLYDDITLPEPATLFDDWADNASPARHQEMTVAEHLNLAYDLFVDPRPGYDPLVEMASDRSGWRNRERMTPGFRALWDAAFATENQAFWEDEPVGDERVRWKVQRYLKDYLRCVRGVDDSVGRLLDHLDASGLADDTVVVYASDQGFFLGDHGWYDKRWMYEESLGMPLLVRWPGVTPAGTVVPELVQNLDYAATFLELAGVPLPDDLQGRSLVPLLRGQHPEDWRDAIYYHYSAYPDVHRVARQRGVRTRRWKLIHFYQLDEWELYDLEADPDELVNLYGQPGTEALTAVLSERLDELADHYGDDTDVDPMPAAWQAERR